MNRQRKSFRKRPEKLEERSKTTEIPVKESALLLDFLMDHFPQERRKLKAVLASGQIAINGVPQTQYNHPLKKGDQISISWVPDHSNYLNKLGIKVIFEDDDLIAVEKPCGMLSVATEKDDMNTLYRHVNQYIKRSDIRQRIFVVHRLDQDTSGVMMFTKTQKLKELFQASWNQLVTERIYYGIVEGAPEQKKGQMDHFLFEDKQKMVHISHSGGKGKKAVTHYEVETVGSGCSLVRFSLQTGRKNQIRVQAKELGHPIVGDQKYGSKLDPLHRLALHAFRLAIKHPVDGRLLSFETQIPANFLRLLQTGC
jgi:23S rRNA pseudouridine1911/1915/1917 synthase